MVLPVGFPPASFSTSMVTISLIGDSCSSGHTRRNLAVTSASFFATMVVSVSIILGFAFGISALLFQLLPGLLRHFRRNLEQRLAVNLLQLENALPLKCPGNALHVSGLEVPGA